MNNQSSIRVLIVDDMKPIRDQYRSILCPDPNPIDAINLLIHGSNQVEQKLKFEITEAKSGEEGIVLAKAAWEANKPFGYAIIDMRMPGISGIQTIEQIRKFDHSVNIIVSSAFYDFSDSDLLASNGGSLPIILHKPINPDLIRAILCQSMNH